MLFCFKIYILYLEIFMSQHCTIVIQYVYISFDMSLNMFIGTFTRIFQEAVFRVNYKKNLSPVPFRSPTPEAYKGTASIGKLLSNGYNQDWYENRDTHFKNHKPSPSDIQFETSTRADRQSTEYRDAINKNVKKPVGGGGGGASYAKNAMEVRGTKKSEQAKTLNNKQDEEKELFKLSK